MHPTNPAVSSKSSAMCYLRSNPARKFATVEELGSFGGFPRIGCRRVNHRNRDPRGWGLDSTLNMQLAPRENWL
jgi:hypothetical protein